MGIYDNFQKTIAEAHNGLASWWNEANTFTQQADTEAEKRFPNQDRDSSVKNSFRHALGAGRLAQLMGSNSGIPVVEGAARGFAKLAGYGWEGLGGLDNLQSTDMRHDLNANAQGIAQSSNTKDFRSLADSLEAFSQGARKELPPNALDKARPYFTYTQ